MSSTSSTRSAEPKADSKLGALVFYSEFDDPVEWSNALKTYLPDLDIRVFPDVGDPADVAAPGPRLAEIERRNRETAEQALRGVLAQRLRKP